MRHIIIAIFMAIPSFHSQAGDLATGMINGCLQTGSSLQACKCQANEVLSNVSEGELASFAQTVAKYSTKQITAKDVPLNYHLAIIGMASCKKNTETKMDNSEKDNNLMKSIKWSMYIWIIGTIIASFVQTSFLHSAGMSNIPPEFYGELAGQILAWIVLFVTLPLYLFFKLVNK